MKVVVGVGRRDDLMKGIDCTCFFVIRDPPPPSRRLSFFLDTLDMLDATRWHNGVTAIDAIDEHL